MKEKITLLSLILLFTTLINYAQTSAEIADIAVQGIARDNNNTAKTNATISLTFELYYLDANNGNSKEVIGTAETVNLATDAFGVFSHIIRPVASNNAIFANQQVYLKISEGGQIISEEKLKHVPYAIAANNGVPTGSIMPFVGAAAPIGWVLCNGQSISSVNGAENLIALIGNNAPDLRGMFLRGAGTNALTPVTTTLNGTQDDTNLSHTHGKGGLVTDLRGAHLHSFQYEATEGVGTNNRFLETNSSGPAGNRTLTRHTGLEGNHNHTISGNTAGSGSSESRPVNYGVNYIIKL